MHDFRDSFVSNLPANNVGLGPRVESIRNDARKQREEYFDGIVAIKNFIQIARIRENERQQSARGIIYGLCWLI